LESKTQDYNKLAADKAQIEETISQMERDLIDLPRRNAELQQVINTKKQELDKSRC